ncbi:MAG: hypothetical protein M0Z60_10890, partial [Nitrospiraceae bacterium]|nr:hypothetical protein [Nitrospiraceae bacterium]
PRKCLYLACLTVISGISMNIYIPAFYLFNLTAFILVLFLLRIASFKEFTSSFRDRRCRINIAASILLVAMMAAPPLMIMSRDASGGELFPILRIAQKNDGNLKKIVASETGGSSLSAGFYGEKGVFDSYGNIVNLLYPEMWNIPFFAKNDLMAEINQYIGLIPLIFCILGLLYVKSRYRWLSVVMLALITVNMFSFEGMSGHPYNALQKIFNFVFPPLKMLDVRETLTAFSLFYLCMLLSMGLTLMFDTGQLGGTIKEKYLQVLAAGGVIIFLKAGITWFFGGKIVAASQQDSFAIEQVVIFILLIFLFSRGSITRKTVCIALVSLIFADLFSYNYLCKRDMLMDRRPMDGVIEAADRPEEHFQYFRDIIASPPGLAFGESILKVKGALTYGNNHSLFSTKRYYDLLTHVRLEDQLALGGVIYPVLRFFPSVDTIRAADRNHALEYFERGAGQEVSDRLVIEDGAAQSNEGHTEVKDFTKYEDVRGFSPYELRSFASRYLEQKGQAIAGARADISGLLNTRDYSLSLREFSPNDITISVKNEKDGYLLYNDGWSRYWRAFDGKREIPVLVANYNSKAVYLPKGAHNVRFVFDPVHYKAGLVLYYAGLLAASGMVVFLYFGDKKKEKE